jgi:hypothetical protein
MLLVDRESEELAVPLLGVNHDDAVAVSLLAAHTTKQQRVQGQSREDTKTKDSDINLKAEETNQTDHGWINTIGTHRKLDQYG